MKKSIDLQPQQSESYYEMGEIAREANQFEEARKYYQTVLGAAPHHGGALTGMGILAFQSKDFPIAEKYLQQLSPMRPTMSRPIITTLSHWLD